MFLITCANKVTGTDLGWLSAMSTDVEQVQITRTRSHARRFRQEADANAARDIAAGIAQDFTWKVVPADADA